MTELTAAPGEPLVKECKHPSITWQMKADNSNGKMKLGISLSCEVCGTPFKFLDLPRAFRSDKPSTSLDGTEARLFVEPF